MSESQSDFYVETYVKKQEAILIETIRRLLQADTKVSVLELALSEQTAKVEELESQSKQLNTALQQSINGLQSLTIERDVLKKNLEEANERIEYLMSIQEKYRTAENELANKTITVDKLSTKVETYKQDLEQLKSNYDKVNNALDEATVKLSSLAKTKETKKPLGTANKSEWTSGNKKKSVASSNPEWSDGN